MTTAQAAVTRLAPGPLIAGGLALVVVIGSMQPWARALFISLAGTETDRGIVTLIAGLLCAGLCALRAFSTLRDRYYFGGGLLVCALAFVMPVWFIVDVEAAATEDLFGNEVRVITTSLGVWLAAAASGGYLLSLGWQWLNRRSQD
jgi:hypothetical protein